MAMHWGDVPAGAVLPFIFDSYAGTTGASVTLTGLAVTDIEVYKGTSMTQRASDAGYTLLDTDGIDIDGITGIHGFSIDTGDNTDAGFYAVGSFYTVVVASVTVDAQTVNFVAGTFSLRPAEATAGYPVVDVALWKGATAPAMTGDAYARLGAPAGASVSADVAAVKSQTAAIEAAIAAIGSGTGAALNFEVTSDNASTPIKSISAVGTQTGTYANTLANDGTLHEIASVANAIDWVYGFNVGAARSASKVVLRASMAALGDTVTVLAYNFNTTAWNVRTTIAGTTETTYDIPLLSAHTGTGVDEGFVYIRFTFSEADAGALIIDEAYVQAQQSGSLTGYSDGAIWVADGASSGTVPYVDGTADNPCTWAAAQTIATLTGLTRFRIRNGSTVTLSAACDSKSLVGRNWHLALGGQSIAGSYFEGASVTGTGTGATPPLFVDCHIVGAAAAPTLPPSVFLRCGINTTVTYPLTAGSAGQFILVDCFSEVAGSGTPYFTFSGANGINIRRWSGGTNITLDNSNTTLSIEVVTGGGQTVALGGADVEIRGICRAVTLTGITSATTAQIDAVTGPIALSGADGTVNIYGVCGVVTDSRTGSPTLSNKALSQDNPVGSVTGAVGSVTSPGTIADAVLDEAAAGHTGVIAVNLDAAVSTRSTLDAAGVWGYATRSLTTFGTLIADIWANATRTLTAFSDSSGVTTLLTRIIGTLAAGTHNPQSGDAFARLGAPAGASVSADVAAVKSDTAAAKTRVELALPNAAPMANDGLPTVITAYGGAILKAPVLLTGYSDNTFSTFLLLNYFSLTLGELGHTTITPIYGNLSDYSDQIGAILVTATGVKRVIAATITTLTLDSAITAGDLSAGCILLPDARSILTVAYDAAKTAATQVSVNDVPTNAEFAAGLAGSDDAVLAAIAALNNAPDVSADVTAVKAVTDELAGMLEADGPVSRYTTNALEQAPTGGAGGLTAQETRDAMKLAPSVGAPAAGSLDDQLAAIPTVGEIDTQLSGTHGAGAWGAGSGAFSKVYTARAGGLPLAGAYCRLCTDATVLAQVDAGTTNALGQVTFWHNLPVGTPVWVAVSCPGYESLIDAEVI